MITSFLVVAPGSAANATGEPAGPPAPPRTAPSASSAWNIQNTRNGHVHSGSLSAVSCSTSTACITVGYYVNSSGASVTLAEGWNGTAWAIQPTPVPAGLRQGSLGAVSCTTSTACIAVGQYSTSSGVSVTLAEGWNGTAWAIQPTPVPAGAASSSLTGVSCTSSTACTAVGRYDDSSDQEVTLAEQWDGTAWAIQPTPVPAGATSSYLNGIACISPTACSAVGRYDTSSHQEVTLAEQWDGTAWVIQPASVPAGAASSDLTGVSCTSSTACTAVGQYYNSSNQELALAEAWNGTAWTIQPTPVPAGSRSSDLTGVTCTSSTACTAVGQYYNSTGDLVTLAERWNGTTWATQPTPARVGATSSYLVAVSCTSVTACTASGYYYTSSSPALTLAEAWNGHRWAIQSTTAPVGTGDSFLDAVSCIAPTACTAVGRYYTKSPDTELTLAETWDGTSWTTQPTPNAAGAGQSRLDAVSCTASNACTAVGGYGSGTSTSALLVEAWNGATWSVKPIPSPAGATYGYLDGVSCTSSTACTAVGQYYNSTGDLVTLAERWNGTTWAIQSTPAPTGAKSSYLEAVSCTASTACTAVGQYYNSTGDLVTLAERWNGTTWAIQPTPVPTGSIFSYLDAVSCTTSTACTAVGGYDTSSASGVLSEHWNGTAWTIQPTPNPGGGTNDSLDAVSCTAATACTAVGTYLNTSNANLTLAEVWNGTSWGVQPTPNPVAVAGTANGQLNAVTCSTTTACTAVGYYGNGYINQTLAEVK
jgi:hypothetical protein